MKKSFYPKALVYKEWLQKRFIALLIFLLISPSVYLNNLTLFADPAHRFVGGQQGVMVNGVTQWGALHYTDTWVLNFSDFCNQILGRYTVGWWASIVVVGLALYTLWSERNHESWTFTLSGPVSKEQVLRTKCTFDALIIIGTFALLAISLMTMDLAVGLHYPLIRIVKWWFAEIALQGSMYSLALLLGTIIGNPIGVGLFSFAVANVPIKLGIFLFTRVGANPGVFLMPHLKNPVPFSWKLIWIVGHLSPLNWLNINLSSNWTSPWPFMIGFVIFSLLSYFVAQLLYQRMENERMNYLFVFRGSKYPLIVALSGSFSFFAVELMFRNPGINPVAEELGWFLALTVALSLFLMLLGQRLVRRA